MRNKGFTMVEMLAVVVLIGLLTVLVVSRIRPSISDSKESVAFSSASSLVARLEEYYFEQKMMGNFTGCTYDFESDNNGCSEFSFTGDKPTGGSVTISADGIINGEVIFGKFSYEIKDNKVVVPEIAYEPKIPIGTEYVFDYTGSEAVLTILSNGNYKLETWGAQGGNANNNRGGYGGYSTGTVYLKEGTKLYINVGGQGSSGDPAVMHAGGYNGGGSVPAESGGNRYVAGGGGATHISLESGLLSNLSSNRDSILIVSGGGGGGYEHTSPGYNGIGGDAGGFVGSNGTYGSSGGGLYGTGGTQTNGGFAYGTSEYAGLFGLGGSVGSAAHGSAGGGGFYGGGASAGGTISSGNSSGGGGSGYIGNDILFDKYMCCYRCTASSLESTLTYSTIQYSEVPTSNYAKVGNGYAKITYLGLDEEVSKNKLDLISLPYKENMTYYFDYKSNIDSTIENYSTGNVDIIPVNASIVDNSIYFSGNNQSYAYTEDNLSENDNFTIYFVAKFSNVYSYNYMISSLSSNSSADFGLGVGRYGAGTDGDNQVIFMASNTSNVSYTDYDVLNYYVYTIVYENGIGKFYLNGSLIAQMDNISSSSKFYFASYLNKNDNNVYGGALINFRQFSFVDAVHTDEQILANSVFLQNKYIYFHNN